MSTPRWTTSTRAACGAQIRMCAPSSVSSAPIGRRRARRAGDDTVVVRADASMASLLFVMTAHALLMMRARRMPRRATRSDVVTDPVESAKAAGLRYVDDQQPGLRR